MAYGFRDLGITNETAMDGLPSEAMTFNGVTIEKVIPEYQTLQVTGREVMGQTLDTLKVGQQDGERIQGHSIPPREITVKYQINADSPERFRAIFYELNQILSGVNNKFYFADDPEKYFVGTLEEASVPDGGKLQVVSDFTILCNDPYAYSVREDEFTFSDEAETVDLTLDLAGKVFGDFNSNPNSIWGAQWHEIESRPPSSLWWEWEQENYAKITKQDGVSGSYTRPDSEETRQSMIANNDFDSTRLMVKFDILNGINKAYPGFWSKYGLIDKNTKIEWLKDNLQSFEFDVWSYGLGASGYGVKVQYWNGSEWTGTQTNAAKMPTKNSYIFTKAEEIVSYLDADGYFYALTGTNDADATHDSTTWLDYVCVKLKLALPVADAINVVNDGPLAVPVRFDITNRGDNGYFGITNDSQSILLGNATQIDGGNTSKSERLFTTDQNNAHGLSQWTMNDGVIASTGIPQFQSGNFEDPSVIKESRWRLRNAQPDMNTAWGLGDPNNQYAWHGPSASVTFPADSKGAVGAKNFTARFYLQSLFGSFDQSADQVLTLFGPDKEWIVGVEFWKHVNNHSSIKIYIGHNLVYSDLNNARWDNFFGYVWVNRSGNTFTITIENVEGSGPKTKETKTFDDPTTAAILCEGMTYWKARWGNEKNYNHVMYNDLYDFWFQKDNVDHYVDIPNTFFEGDTINVSGTENKVVTDINGTQSLALQNMGSKTIMAKPGDNIISFMYSDFANRPDVKAYIRKKYL